MVALLLPVVVGIVAFSVDIGLMTLLRAQIQNAVDAGALAASLALGQDPEGVDEAAAAARQFIQLNRVGMTVSVPDDAIAVEVGQWDAETKTFTVAGDEANAVRVFARQDDQPFFFGRIFGRTTFGAPASAIATSSGDPADIMMVLDLSGSMQTHGRIEALWHSAPVFVDLMEQYGGNDQIGVMGLSANPGSYDPVDAGHSGRLYNSGLHPSDDHHVGVLERTLTDDFNDIRNNILTSSNLQAAKYGGHTGTGAAVGDAAHYLTYGSEAREDVRKIIVLMSDGYANRPSSNGPGYARDMAAYAASHDVTIHTISLGNDADLQLMGDIAAITGGIHVDATGSGWGTLTEQLTDAFKKIAAAIKRTHLVQ